MSLNEKPSKETKQEWNQNPNNWIWGLFYFNKDDKRIFPPKRTPWMGWTINFANTRSIAVFVLVIALIIILNYFKK